jgi:potassium efflux system protein
MLLRLYTLNDERSGLANIEELANQLAAEAGDISDAMRAEFLQLLDAQRAILEPYIKDCERYSSNLAELHSVESELISTTDEYADFIAERVLWIRSCSLLSSSDWRPAVGAVAWSLDPRNWRDAGAAVAQAGSRQPALFTLFTIGFATLAAAQRPARRRLRELGEEADKRSCTRLAPTLHALWLTAALSAPWPALLAFIGWSMDSLNESEFVRSLSMAIRFTAICLLLLELSRHLCRRGGLADCHFDWPDACLVHLKRNLRWLSMLGMPMVLWLVGLEVQEAEPLWSSSLGRVCFIAAMLLLAAVLHRLLLARKSPFRQLVLISGGGWLTPLQLSWRPALVLLPAALAVLAAIGYYFTALQAAVRVLETVAILLSVLALGGVTRRWLLVNRRRLAREQAKQRRAQLAAAAEADSAAPPIPELADEAIDLAAISEQTQKLVRTFLAFMTAVGLVLIWGEILPALAYPAARLMPGAEELTWGHLVTCLLVLAVTYVSVRDIPALLELVVLQHLPLDGGARYAFTSLSRYLLTAIGLTAAFNAILIQWGDIQWLVAAMSVGLGFGLQEIFANFVSGVILLFERPIRVGDIVTLGDKSGVVSRIRMRATTIVDWDRKEYIVPNKDLVTGRLLNWTLSDQMNRIEIIISLAHGADTNLACALLLEAAREQPYILAEPAPNAAFEGLTEHGLKLALRCFLPTLENRGTTIHELHTAIDRKFRTAGIEVAAPPREMRLRLLRDGQKTMVDARRIA